MIKNIIQAIKKKKNRKIYYCLDGKILFIVIKLLIMKYLLFFLGGLLIYSCSKFESAKIDESTISNDQVVFSSSSTKPQKGYFRGHLSGEETNATGQINFRFDADNNSVYYKLIVANIDNVTAAHLHHSHMGEVPGHPVLTLFSGLAEGTTNGTLAEGILTDDDINCSCGNPDHQNLAQLRKHIEAGETTVLVHTENFPEGEIGGEIN
ncbi:MAG: CHRD domain-containing protein [Saprospiraceae bacterium]|nr:CHRD domain-containing protein [Saprospiraceae bacterium]